jgi:integrase
MPIVKLNDKFCKSVKAESGRQVDYFDELVTGLCLRVSPGGTLTWQLIYTRPENNKRARVKLGRYPDMPLAGAREAAKGARVKLAQGGDPGREKATAMTVADLVESYLARSTTKRNGSPKRSLPEIARRLRKNVTAVIGAIRLADLHKRDVTRCVDAVKDRGAGLEANRVFEDLRAMMRWAHGRGDIDGLLTLGMRKPTGTEPRDRALTPEEIRIMWAALPQAEMREVTRNVLRLCLITAQRVGEVAGISRDELDLEARIWTIGANRTKNSVEQKCPLSEMALRIIGEQMAANEALTARKNRKPSRFLFPAPGGRAPIDGGSIAKAVKREEKPVGKPNALTVGVEPWTPHDLRRTAATEMEALGVSPIVIGHVLNHESTKKATVTSKVYARYTYDREKREALELWGAHLTRITVGDQVDNVVPFQAVR